MEGLTAECYRELFEAVVQHGVRTARLSGELPVRVSLYELLEEDSPLESRDGSAEAGVLAEAEGDVGQVTYFCRLHIFVETVGLPSRDGKALYSTCNSRRMILPVGLRGSFSMWRILRGTL